MRSKKKLGWDFWFFYCFFWRKKEERFLVGRDDYMGLIVGRLVFLKESIRGVFSGVGEWTRWFFEVA